MSLLIITKCGRRYISQCGEIWPENVYLCSTREQNMHVFHNHLSNTCTAHTKRIQKDWIAINKYDLYGVRQLYSLLYTISIIYA